MELLYTKKSKRFFQWSGHCAFGLHQFLFWNWTVIIRKLGLALYPPEKSVLPFFCWHTNLTRCFDDFLQRNSQSLHGGGAGRQRTGKSRQSKRRHSQQKQQKTSTTLAPPFAKKDDLATKSNSIAEQDAEDESAIGSGPSFYRWVSAL